VSSPQALQFQYIILIPYILDDYRTDLPISYNYKNVYVCMYVCAHRGRGPRGKRAYGKGKGTVDKGPGNYFIVKEEEAIGKVITVGRTNKKVGKGISQKGKKVIKV
jgi:hypothetical protein